METAYFIDFDFSDFWDDSMYALQEYVNEPPSNELIQSIEQELGYKLPASYIWLMKQHNGGIPRKTCFPLLESDSYIAITGIFGIERDKPYSLGGALGSQFRIDEWEYPAIGVYICSCPSAGHDMVLLDYSKCGNEGEPEVVHIDQELDYEKTFLAKDFETFIRGLVSEEVYDTSEEDLKTTLETLQSGSFSNLLQDCFKAATNLDFARILRNILLELTHQKGYFALHDDDLSKLVYDIQFYLLTKTKSIASREVYLEEYPFMFVFDGEITTGGYAPGFVEDWLEEKIKEKTIITTSSNELTFNDLYVGHLLERLRQYQ